MSHEVIKKPKGTQKPKGAPEAQRGPKSPKGAQKPKEIEAWKDPRGLLSVEIFQYFKIAVSASFNTEE